MGGSVGDVIQDVSISYVTTNKAKKKGKKKKTHQSQAPLPKNALRPQTPPPFESDKDLASEHDSSAELSRSPTSSNGPKSIFTQLAEHQRKELKRPQQRGSSVEVSIQSDGGVWNVIPQRRVVNEPSRLQKTSTITGSASTSAIFETEDSHDVTDVESSQEVLSRRSGTTKSSKKSKKSPLVQGEPEDEDEIIRQYKASRPSSIPSLSTLLQLGWKFLKSLDLRTVAILVGAIILIFALKLGEESYMEARGGGEVIETDLYGILHVAKSATKREIERAYRRLSVEWHPDRNPDCPQCMKKFQEISHAYTVLANKESREVYDTSSSSFTAIESSAITLTPENFDTIITDTLDYKTWVIQAYTDLEELCRYIAPAWEDAVLRLGKSVGFARIDARKTKGLLSRLPVKVRIFPMIVMLSRDQPPEIYQNIYHISASNLRSWIIRHFPSTHKRLYDANSIDAFLSAAPFSTNPRFPLIVTSPQPSLPLFVRSQIYYHKDLFECGHTLLHEAKSFVGDWKLIEPDKQINIVHFPLRVYNDQFSSSPRPIKVYNIPTNATEDYIGTVFRKLRRGMPASLTLASSSVLCGNEHDRTGSICLIRVFDHGSSPPVLQFTAPRNDEEEEEEEDTPNRHVAEDDSTDQREEQTSRNHGYSILTKATDRASTAAHLFIHGGKKINFEDPEFWTQKVLKRNSKSIEGEGNDQEFEEFLQLTYMIRPPVLSKWIRKPFAWFRPLLIFHPYLACHDLWGNVLREADLLIFQRSSGRVLPLHRVETSLTHAVEMAVDLFNGFVDIDVSSQIRLLSAAKSADWRGKDVKQQHSTWDARLLSCQTSLSTQSTTKALFHAMIVYKTFTLILVLCIGCLIWWLGAVVVSSLREPT